MRSPGREQEAGWLVALAVLATAAPAAEVKVTSATPKAAVSIVRRVNVDYHLLTGAQPVEFDVSGPAWLRVYTRLWWPRGTGDTQKYTVSLWQDDASRTMDFDVSVSPSSFGPGGRKLGEWRSFFVQLPAGANHYRLVLDEAVTDTVGVRFAFQSPRPWQAVPLGTRSLELVEGRDTVEFHELEARRPVKFRVVGPGRVRVRARLNYSPELPGEQSLVLAVTEGKATVARRSLRVGRSASASYASEPGLVPSSERSMRFGLGPGVHELALTLSGTMAKTGAVLVEVLAGEKYE